MGASEAPFQDSEAWPPGVMAWVPQALDPEVEKLAAADWDQTGIGAGHCTHPRTKGNSN